MAFTERLIGVEDTGDSFIRQLETINGDKSKELTDRQAKFFNIGNGDKIENPRETAERLLRREYGDTFLFEVNEHAPVYIPPIFPSKAYKPKVLGDLNYDFYGSIKKWIGNKGKEDEEPWYLKHLKCLTREEYDNENYFREWRMKLKILYCYDGLQDQITDESFKNIEFHELWKMREPLLAKRDEVFKILKDIGINNELKRNWDTTMRKLSICSDLPIQFSGIDIHTRNGVKKIRNKINEIEKETVKKKRQVENEVSKKKENVVKKDTLVIRVTLKKEICSRRPTDSLLNILFEDIFLIGEELEHLLYDQLSKLKDTDLLKDMLVFYSLNIYTDIPSNRNVEHDFILFSHTRRLAISIEVKKTLTEDAFESACKQSERLYNNILRTRFEGHLNNWTFVPLIFTYEDTRGTKSFAERVFFPFDLVERLTKIINTYKEDYDDREQLKKVVAFLVFIIHCGPPIVESGLERYLENALNHITTKENIVFYSKNQLPIFLCKERFRKLFILGGFGTGKSFLMQQKVNELLVKYKAKDVKAYKIWYVLLGEHSPLLFEKHLKKLWASKTKLEVKTFKDLKEVLRELEQTQTQLSAHQISIFIDELHQPLAANQTIIETLSKLVDHLWIAPANNVQVRLINCDEYKKCLEHLKSNIEFEVLEMDVNFRNNKKIALLPIHHMINNEKYTPSKLAPPPGNCPSGRQPLPVESLADGIKKAQEKAKRGVLVIIGNIDDDNDRDFEHHFGGITDTEKSTMRYLDHPGDGAWERRALRLLGIDIPKIQVNPIDFLNEKNNVLFVSINSVNGFEWPTVVYYGNLLHDTTPSINSFCRCTTSLYYTTFPGNLKTIIES